MPELEEQVTSQLSGRYAVWFVPGAWWVTSLEPDGTVISPGGPPPLPDPCLN